MNSAAINPTDLSGGQTPDKALGNFVRELSASLREVNNSVLAMSQLIVDRVINNDLPSVQEEATQRTSAAENDDAFIVVSDPSVHIATDQAPGLSSAVASTSEDTPPTTASATGNPTHKWYAVFVGRNPGVFYGSSTVPTNTERIPGGLALKYDTKEDAQAQWDIRLRAGLVKQVTLTEDLWTYQQVYGCENGSQQ